MLDAYYKFAKMAEHAKHRLDCIASTQNYEPLEEKRATKERNASDKSDAIKIGSLQVSLGAPHTPEQLRKASLCVGCKSKTLSLIKRPDASTPNLGYGDIKDTSDALLFMLNGKITDGVMEQGGTLEIFVIKGGCHYDGLFTEFADGEYDEEIEKLRSSAMPE